MIDPRLASEFYVRRFASTDSISELTRLLHRAYRPLLLQGFHYVASQQTDEITQRRIDQGECFVAASNADERIVGTVTLRTAPFSGTCPYYEKEGVTGFQQFAVDPSFQGRGIGKQLLHNVECRARELGYRELGLDTAEGAKQLIEMYRTMGFQEVGRVNWGVTNYESIVMAKFL